MKFIFGIAGGVVLVSGGYVGVASQRSTQLLPVGTVIGVVPVGGLTTEDAQKKLRLYWESEKSRKVSIQSKAIPSLAGSYSAPELGLKLDDVASVKQVPFDEFLTSAARVVGLNNQAPKVPFVFVVDPVASKKFHTLVKERAPSLSPATVKFENGKVIRKYEQAGLALDEEAFIKVIPDAFLNETPIELPLKEGEKSIPDAELDKVKEVFSMFTTNFPTHKVTRCQNIKLASSLLDGHLVLPGEKFSFNEVVGQRTIARGFKEAGIFNNGKHDTGVGGGICQVSTTLYNTALLGGLKILQRDPHSMAVPYVPIGRDCVVSFPNLDLKFQNTFDYPIAIDSEYVPGKLTFRLLGLKEKGLEILIERGKVNSWGRGVRYEHDPSLAYGVTKLVDRGGSAHSVATWRIFKKDGKVIKRESLGQSVYAGAPRTLAKNMKAGRPAPKANVSPVTPTTSAPEAPGSAPSSPSDTDQ